MALVNHNDNGDFLRVLRSGVVPLDLKLHRLVCSACTIVLDNGIETAMNFVTARETYDAMMEGRPIDFTRCMAVSYLLGEDPNNFDFSMFRINGSPPPEDLAFGRDNVTMWILYKLFRDAWVFSTRSSMRIDAALLMVVMFAYRRIGIQDVPEAELEEWVAIISAFFYPLQEYAVANDNNPNLYLPPAHGARGLPDMGDNNRDGAIGAVNAADAVAVPVAVPVNDDDDDDDDADEDDDMAIVHPHPH